MGELGIILFGAGTGLVVYTYALYPGLLRILGAGKGRSRPPPEPDDWQIGRAHV